MYKCQKKYLKKFLFYYFLSSLFISRFSQLDIFLFKSLLDTFIHVHVSSLLYLNDFSFECFESRQIVTANRCCYFGFGVVEETTCVRSSTTWMVAAWQQRTSRDRFGSTFLCHLSRRAEERAIERRIALSSSRRIWGSTWRILARLERYYFTIQYFGEAMTHPFEQ